MGSLGEVHYDQRNSCCERCGKPLEFRQFRVVEIQIENCRDNDTDQSAEEMSEYEIARLRERNIDGPITQNGGCTLKRQPWWPNL